ncbi:MAG: c-type cytochrome [Chromatiales bacterium]|nr:MAG: c-type cytochrome [Chromatiales bacterium]
MTTCRSIAPALIAVLTLAGSIALAQVTEQDTALAANDCTPQGELRGDPARGKELHLQDCAECHGETGKVDVIVMHMDVPPKDQSDPAYMGTLTDAFLYLAICRGGAPVGRSIVMPAWGDYYSDQDIKDLVAHIRSFSGT